MKLFKRPFKVKGERISFSAAICGIINVQEVKEIDVLIDYLEYLVQLKPKSDRTILIQNDQHTKEGFLYEQEVKKYMATAIEEDLFEVYYQPLYDLKEKKISYNGSIKPIETSVTWNDFTRSFYWNCRETWTDRKAWVSSIPKGL